MKVYLPEWWTFHTWSTFRTWYRNTDRAAEERFHARCTRGISREFLFTEFVCCDDAARAMGIQGDLQRFRASLPRKDNHTYLSLV
jgi:hypothetical protein